MRSNQALMVVQTLEITHAESGQTSSLTVTGNYQGTESAEVRVPAFKREAHSAEGVHHGWVLTTGGLALANPGSQEDLIDLQLAGEPFLETAQIVLPAGTQRSFLIGDLFPGFADQEGINRGWLTIRSQQGVPFAVTALEQETLVDFSGDLIFSGSQLPLLFEYIYFKTPDLRSFDFPVQIKGQLAIQDLWIVLSQFGFNLATPDGQPLAVYKMETPGGVKGNADAGIAVVYGRLSYSDSAIIFTQSRKVLWVSTQGEPEMEDLPEENQVRIRMGSPCYRVIILLDKLKEEIISIEHTRDPGSWCL